MAHNEIEGNVIGEVWRAQEAAAEIIFFRVASDPLWFKLEYSGDRMLDRANYMADRLKIAASGGGGVEVGVDFEDIAEGSPQATFHRVSFIEIRA
jgi:hypothetical protein